MLQIHIKGDELYDEFTGRFIEIPSTDVDLEHSLYAVAEWERKYHKAFFGPGANDGIKTDDELFYYLECMSNHKVQESSFRLLRQDDIKQILDYMADPHTATHPKKLQQNGRPNREIMTAEIFYSQMIELGIPLECQYWHLSSLTMLIEVVGRRSAAANGKKGKGNKGDLASKYNAMNQSRLRSGCKG